MSILNYMFFNHDEQKMSYSRSLNLTELRKQLEEKFIGDGLKPANAKKAAHLLSAGDADNVQKDLQRHHNIILINEITNKTTNIDVSQFDTLMKTKGFLRMLAREHEALYEYLQKYTHQGGFLHLTEFLLSYYFLPDVRLTTDNRVATFTIRKDGSIGYEEKFDVTSIASQDINYQLDNEKPLMSFTLKSTIKLDGHNVKHTGGDVHVKVHDNVAQKFINDPRNKFSQFLSWLKESFVALFSTTAHTQLQQKQSIQNPRKKL